MSKTPEDRGGRDGIPRVESPLFAGLARVRKLGLDPQVVLEDAEEGPAVAAPREARGGSPSSRIRYVLQGEIGRGGMGAIYKVLDTDLRRSLAMKVALTSQEEAKPSSDDSQPSLLERFLEEAQVTGQLDHPGIVPLHELGIDDQGRVYFTMRLVRGRHLGEIFELARSGEEEWSEERVIVALLRVCEAMAYAHAKGVVHRDLKPANVMAGRFGEVYVMDWGLAKVRGRVSRSDRSRANPGETHSVIRTRRDEEDDADSLQTSHGTVFGTPAYMSPEQARGEIERIDARSDVYSLGAILYHFLTRHPPYSHGGAKIAGHTVLKWLLEGPPEPVRKLAPNTAPELAAICEKAMARDPEDRYPSMQALAEDLRNHLRGRPVKALRIGTVGRIVRWGRKNPLAAGMLAAVMAGSIYGIGRLASLGNTLIQQTALDSAAMKAQILQDVNSFYSSQVAARVDKQHTEVTHDYAQKAGAIPIPATFLTELGEKISAHTGGVRVRQYSDFPFNFRAPWVLDDFERTALAELRTDPSKPVSSFEELEGKPVLRYAIGRLMEPSCVACHNTHAASVKKDWQVGDVRGVLEIIRPLDQDVARVQKGLSGTLVVVAAIVGGLMLLSAIGIVRNARRLGERSGI